MHVGVRFDDADVHRRAERAYAEHLVIDEAAVDDLSLSLHPPTGDGTARRRPSLRHGGCDVVRSGSADRLLRALDCFLAGIGGPPSGMVRFDRVGAVIVDGRASLVPTTLLDRSSAVERRMAEAGAIADGLSAAVDPARREIVVRPGLVGDEALEVESEVLARPGRYPLHRIHWSELEADENESAAIGLVRLLNRIDASRERVDRDAFLHLVRLGDRFSSILAGERGVRDLDAIVADFFT